MDQSKKFNDDWVLCPSKSFPGKNYYFNITTGEAMWCYNNTGNSGPKPNLQEENHTYPEPITPPGKVSPSTQFPFTPYQGNMMQSSYAPGCSTMKDSMAVSMYVPPFDGSYNYMRPMMPYQMPPPMFWPPQMFTPYYGQSNPNIMGWPVAPQPQVIEIKSPEPDVTVHTGKLPLNKRFVNFRDPILKDHDNNLDTPKYQVSIKSNSSDKSLKKSPGTQTLTHNKNIQTQDLNSDLDLNKTTALVESMEINYNFSNKSMHSNESNNRVLLNGSCEPNTYNSLTKNTNRAFSPSINPNHKPHRQINPNQHVFGHRPKFANNFSNINNTKPGPFSQNKIDTNIFGKTQWDQNQTSNMFSKQNEPNFWVSSQRSKQNSFNQYLNNDKVVSEPKPINKQGPNDLSNTHSLSSVQHERKTNGLFNETQHHQNLSDEYLHEYETQNNQDIVDENETSFTSLQTDYELNLLHKHNLKKSALKQRTKEQLPAISELKHAVSAEEEYDKENSTLSEGDKVENETPDGPHHLDENDLRRLLLKKRRKTVDSTANGTEGRKIKTIKQDIPKEKSVKKVTFNPVLDVFSDVSNENTSPNREDSMCEEVCEDKYWYAVADTTTLLEEYDLIEQFVKSDPWCRLVVPRAVATVARRARPPALVASARRVLRALHAPRTHLVLQMSEERTSPNTSSSFSVLSCCLDMMENNRVVLITNDDALRVKAEDLGIECISTQDIINQTKKQQTLQFDFKKIKISIPNEPEMVENRGNDYISDTNDDFEYSTLDQKALNTKFSKPLYKINTCKTVSLNDDNSNSAPSGRKLNLRNSKKIVDFPKYNEIIKPHFQNNDSVNGTVDLEKQPTSLLVDKTDERNDSMFKQTNQTPGIQSIFKKGSKFDNATWKQRDTNTILSTDTENEETEPIHSQFKNNILKNQAQASNFEIEKIGHTENSNASICEVTNKDIKTRNTDFEKASTASDTKFDLEEFVQNFSMKNVDLEQVTEQKKDEIICSFRQIMEDYLFDILQNHTNYLEKVHGMAPPFSLKESLLCLGLVYGRHASVREIAGVLSGLLDSKGEVPRSEVVRSLACAMALVSCLKSVCEAAEAARGLRLALAALVRAARAPGGDLPASPTRTNTRAEEQRRINFRKDRSEVLQYLKKHNPTWADSDDVDLMEDNSVPAWGKNHREAMIVRVCGKNLSKLTLNSSKPMSINDSRHCDRVSTSSPKQQKENNNIKILKMTRNTDPRIYSKQLKLTAVVENTDHDQNTASNNEIEKNQYKIDENQNIFEKNTEQKVVRLFNKYDFVKTDESKQPVLDITDTAGHTFGSKGQDGPKVLRNIQPIKEFEEKIKYGNTNMDIDDQDLSTMSLSAYERFVTEINNNDNTDNRNDSTNGCEPENDIMNITNDTSTNNKNVSMSLDNSLEDNYMHITDDTDTNLMQTNMINPKIEMIDPKYDMTNSNTDICNPKNDNTNSANDNLDFVSFDTSGFDEYFGITDDFKLPDSNKLNSLVENQNMDNGKNDKSAENMTERSYRTVDTFLFELKNSFKMIHTFIRCSVKWFRSGAAPAPPAGAVRDAALRAQGRLYDIVRILDRISYRETVSGPRVQDMFKGSLFEDDVRVQNYRQIVSKCVEQVMMMNKALKMLLQLAATKGKEEHPGLNDTRNVLADNV